MKKTNKPSGISLLKSFGFALEGIRQLITERNFRIHLLAAVIVITAGVVLKISSVEWCVITIVVGLVISAEAFNSAIEEICNRITLDQDPLIKKIKDISAGAVLIMAIASVIAGLFIFLPKII